MASILDASIQNIRYFGPAAVKKLAKLKIKTARDLLYHFPFRYEDFSNFTPIADLKPNSQATTHGTILNAKNIQIFRRRLILTEIIAEDNSGAIKSVWFNQPYLLNQFKQGRQLNLSGKVVLNKKQLCFSNPAYEITNYGENSYNKKESLHTGRLVPVYPETYGLTSRWLRLGIKSLLRFANQIPDVLPNELKKNYHLPNLGHALSQIHFPETIEKAGLARRRFAFEELFILQLFMGLERLKLEKKTSPQIKFDEKMAKKFVSKLPFKLTDSQKKAAWQIIQDIGRNQPMNRLLEGDVGSGKTIVAAMAAYLTVLNGYQVAFMAPTEILSRQHYEKIWPLLKKFSAKGGSASGGKISTGLLTSTEAKIGDKKISKKELIKKIEAGEISIVIGTHSLIQKNVRFKNLALVVIDEQHRFGVNQRAALLAQHATPSTDSGQAHNTQHTTIPHLLSMTATPIPRTLGLTIWGDLDLSLIKEMPKGRKNIITKIVSPSKREWTYEFIKSEIKKGRQAFVVCPLIEESEKLSAKAVKKEYERLQEKVFPELKIGLLHGRLRPKEKEKIMSEFLNKNLNILVATSVVEVGIDIPNATVMVIEGADRFGLASLYQFRGRVGRSNHQSYCFLLTDSPSSKTNKRLKAIESAQSGFDLAERDLEIRGPGDFIGVRQSGLPDLAIASLTNLKLIEETREAAKKFLVEDPNLKNHPLLAKRVSEFQTQIHFE
ncbi:MAG: ATP-dependent DNA helicase RecG [Candidatus Azambacteria bacterium]|nr:ATP-dependent DNA helicase RecG [Candidatus Azambacteria bacterium]